MSAAVEIIPAPSPAPFELAHRLDFVGRGNCPCGCVSRQRYDAEIVVPETDDDSSALGSALQYTCLRCTGTYSLSFVRRPDFTDADLLKVLDRRGSK